MLGRAAYQNPWLLHDVDERFFGMASSSQSRTQTVESLIPYIDAQLANGARLHHVVRHKLGLYQGQYGGRQYRRHLSEHAHQATSGSEVLREAIAFCSAPERDITRADVALNA
jgi:tRNA-dihydrouridine synthase A